jgi:PAS domain S-box-containing protein
MPHPYVLVSLLACLANAVLAVFFLTRAPARSANRIAGTLHAGAAFWAVCELLWNGATDPAAALSLVRLSVLGWAAIGPLGMEMLLAVSGTQTQATRRARPWLLAIAAGFVCLDLTTPWMHTGVVPRDWGWSYTVGPAFPAYYLFSMACLGHGIRRAIAGLRSSPSPAERRQTRSVIAAFLVPILVASLTEALLPWLGVHPPHLGTLSFVAIGASVAWGFHRYGHSLLAPQDFASEILETLGDGVALVNLDGRIRSANGTLARLVGTTPERLEGQAIGELLDDVPLDPRDALREHETELSDRAGNRLPVSISSATLRDKQGLPIGLVLVVRDLHEMAALRRRLVTSGRLAAVAELAGGIAHEINNPIAYVRTNLGVLRDELEALERRLEGEDTALDKLRGTRELIGESLEGVDRIAAIVRDLKGFAGKDHVTRELVDVNELLRGSLRLLAPHLRYEARVEVRLSDVPLVAGSPQELKQVFTNLILNACQAVGQGGAIVLVTERAEGGVEVRVQDDGRGIAPEVMDRIFDPFFTTRPGSESMGLGLAVAYQIVRQHGGDIAVESRPGTGTVVRVRLPAAS